MLKISLINMPFAMLQLPTVALTQLQSVIHQRFAGRARVRILYMNHDFAHYFGQDAYQALLSDTNTSMSALGEWAFRKVAFPELPDNTREYFERYYPQLGEDLSALKGRLLAKRGGMERFMRQLVGRYQLEAEDVVGFTSMFAQNLPSFAMARVVKAANPRMLTVLGGANCEAPMGRELARQIEPIDFVFSGAGLVSFAQFVGHLLEDEPDQCHRIRGVYSRRNLDSEHLKGHGQMGEELPIEVPVPLDYDSFLDVVDQLPRRVTPSICFETSRGCWWGERAHCTFCGLNGGTMAYRAMPPRMALEVIQDLLERYSDRCERFESVDNIMPREYLTDVFPRLEAPPGVRIFYEVKADLKEGELEILSKAGVNELQPGIESLNSSTLKLMKKGTTGFGNIAFLKHCRRYGVRPFWNLLIGFPQEGEQVWEKYLRDIPLLSHLPAPTGSYPVRFDRYSPYHMRAEEYGLDLAPYDFYSYIYPFGQEAQMRMAYYFVDRKRPREESERLESWKQRLNTAIGHWEQRWYATDGLLKGELFLKRNGEEGFYVRDTRSGEAREWPLPLASVELLRFLHFRGFRIPDMARHLNWDLEQVREEIERLDGWNLLFEENERYMSLLLSNELTDQSLELPGAALASAGAGEMASR